MGFRAERPTPEQWHVTAWMFIVVFATIGSVGLWFGFRAPANQPEIAGQLVRLGAWSLLAAIVVWAVKRV
jgi:hypothetical protein